MISLVCAFLSILRNCTLRSLFACLVPPPTLLGPFSVEVGEWEPRPLLDIPPETIIDGMSGKTRHSSKAAQTTLQNGYLDVLVTVETIF